MVKQGAQPGRWHKPCRSPQFALLFAKRMLRNLGAPIHCFEQSMRAIFLGSSLTTIDCERTEFNAIEILSASRLGEIWGRSETEGTFRKWSYALAHAHSLEIELDFKKNKNGLRKK
jgi:hypothetical protein